jgi:two-component system KDP operon response regulator KdpE
MNEHRRILVVDDESQITRVLRTSLSSQGYDIRVANDGETALEIMKDWTPDLVITDLSMPNMDGLELCRRLRLSTKIPIIVLSVKGEERTKVQALDAGADDYVTKPFGIEELLARIRASLRRHAQGESLGPFQSKELRIDFERRQVIVRDAEVHLAPKEYEVLKLLVVNQGKPLTHRRLLQSVWGPDYGEETENLRVVINQLRKKIESDPAHPKLLLTEPWVGYRFAPSRTTLKASGRKGDRS